VIDAALLSEAEGMNALIIDCMLDPALDAAREAVGVPVIGCGEAGMRAAAAKGPFSVVTVLQRQERAFHELATRYGLADRLKSVRGIGVSVLELEKDSEASIAAAVREAKAAIETDGARSIVFGCTGMLGYGPPVAEALGIPQDRVIDPLLCAVQVAHKYASNGRVTDKQTYPVPEAKRVTGFAGWHALDLLMAGRK
ncbi:MAG: aspartate/glutamate racemase family protein, partial [Hyphomicrobiales bacterium]|nr:aspartate/glutamate racemase family protein [Hyphomicrobiales bacterium]